MTDFENNIHAGSMSHRSLAPAPSSRGFSPWRFGLLLAILIAAAFPQVLLGVETFVSRDYGFFVYPLALFQKQCFWHGELPFWDPYNNCGVPFLAQWNTMPLYPPSLVYLLLPLNWSLSFFSLLHLWFAGLGMYFLARRWTSHPAAAAFAGTVFAFNGFTLNLLMWPSHIATFSWMPWVILAVENAWRQGGKRIPLAAFAGAMQMLAGGPETIFLTWLIVGGLWLQQFPQAASPRRALLWRFPLVIALVFLLSAVQIFPFLDLVAHAQRATGYTDLRWSLPRFGLASFLVPMAFGSTVTEGIFFQHGQYWTSSYYLGIGTVWLAILTVFGLWRPFPADDDRDGYGGHDHSSRQRTWFLVVIAAVALLCALGGNTPFYPLVRRLIPQLSFITYPVKFVMVVVFAAPLLAALTVAGLVAHAPRDAAAKSRQTRQLAVIGGMILLLIAAITVWTQVGSLPGENTAAALGSGISRSAFALATGFALFALARAATPTALRLAPLALIVIGWLDVFTHEPRQNPTVPPGIYAPNLARTKLAMDPQPELGGSRVMLSPSAALGLMSWAASDPKTNFLAKRIGYCANVNLLDAVPKVDGFFSLTPRHFDWLLTLLYSTTNNGNWSHAEDFMGASQMTSPTNPFAWQARPDFLPLVTAGQAPIYIDDTNALWAFARNDLDLRHTVVLPPEEQAAVTVSNSTPAEILDAKFTDRTVDFQVQSPGPALALVAQSYYHDWHAKIDGHPAPLLRANVAFQAVQVPGGRHEVHLYYEDRAFVIGAAISICMWVNCFVSFLALRRRDLPPSPAPRDGGFF